MAFILLTNKYSNKYTYEGQVVIRKRRGLGADILSFCSLAPVARLNRTGAQSEMKNWWYKGACHSQSPRTNCDSLI